MQTNFKKHSTHHFSVIACFHNLLHNILLTYYTFIFTNFLLTKSGYLHEKFKIIRFCNILVYEIFSYNSKVIS